MNNLKTPDQYFEGNKTFKKRDDWISELDLCVTSHHLIKSLCGFSVIQRGDLPSDHAPVAVTITVKGMDLDSTLARASSLGGHAALCGPASKVKQVKKPLRFHMIDKGLFSRNIGSRCDDINMDANIDLVASQVAEVVYSAAERSVGRTVAGRYQDTLSRWERLLGENDDSEV